MNIKQLIYFSKIYELRNMNRAAESLHISQPALSQQISLLEEELTSTLFTRERNGVQPTNEGALLYRHAQIIIRYFDATKALLSNQNKELPLISGSVSIGLATSTTNILALALIKRIKEKFPAVILEIVSITSNDLPKLIQDGRVDFILAPDPHHATGITIKNLVVEELFFLATKGLLQTDEPVAIKDIAHLPLILPSQPNKLRSRIDHAFLIERMPYNLIAESGTISVLIPAIVNGLAATILPYSSAKNEIENKSIFAHQFQQRLFREISICYNSNMIVSDTVQVVIDECMQLIKAMIDSGEWKNCKWVG